MNINYPFYRAEVIDVEDPNKLNRVKVYIPDLMEDRINSDSNSAEGLWALPANTPVGGRNVKCNNFGSSIIPPLFSWVMIFFEGGNHDNPYYFMAFNAYNTAIIPELDFPKDPSIEANDNLIFSLIEQTENNDSLPYEEKSQRIRNLIKLLSPNKAHLKAILYRSYNHGRTLVFSDDNLDERTEITGKKRNYIKTGVERQDPETQIDYKQFPKHYKESVKNSVFEIKGNMSTVLIDDRAGKEKILIKTFKGDYINLDAALGNISIKATNNLYLEAENGDIVINPKCGSIHLNAQESEDILYQKISSLSDEDFEFLGLRVPQSPLDRQKLLEYLRSEDPSLYQYLIGNLPGQIRMECENEFSFASKWYTNWNQKPKLIKMSNKILDEEYVDGGDSKDYYTIVHDANFIFQSSGMNLTIDPQRLVKSITVDPSGMGVYSIINGHFNIRAMDLNLNLKPEEFYSKFEETDEEYNIKKLNESYFNLRSNNLLLSQEPSEIIQPENHPEDGKKKEKELYGGKYVRTSMNSDIYNRYHLLIQPEDKPSEPKPSKYTELLGGEHKTYGLKNDVLFEGVEFTHEDTQETEFRTSDLKMSATNVYVKSNTNFSKDSYDYFTDKEHKSVTNENGMYKLEGCKIYNKAEAGGDETQSNLNLQAGSININGSDALSSSKNLKMGSDEVHIATANFYALSPTPGASSPEPSQPSLDPTTAEEYSIEPELPDEPNWIEAFISYANGRRDDDYE